MKNKLEFMLYGETGTGDKTLSAIDKVASTAPNMYDYMGIDSTTGNHIFRDLNKCENTEELRMVDGKLQMVKCVHPPKKITETCWIFVKHTTDFCQLTASESYEQLKSQYKKIELVLDDVFL